MTTNGERLQCLVPGCRHTTAARRKNGEVWTSWICSRHWMALPRQRRRVWYRRWRRYRMTGAWDRTTQQRVWSRLVAMAIERAVGIS